MDQANQPNQAKTEFTTDIPTIKACSRCGGTPPTVTLPWDIDAKIRAMSSKMGAIEWLAYLVGELSEDQKDFYITDLLVPKQTVSSTSVEVDEPLSAGILGTVHSHHNMGAFHSNTDDTYIGENHIITLVYGNAAEKPYVAKIRLTTPCGGYFLVDTKVFVEKPEPEGLQEFIDSSLLMIEERVYVQPYAGGYYNHSNAYGRWENGAWIRNDQPTLPNLNQSQVSHVNPNPNEWKVCRVCNKPLLHNIGVHDQEGARHYTCPDPTDLAGILALPLGKLSGKKLKKGLDVGELFCAGCHEAIANDDLVKWVGDQALHLECQVGMGAP